APGSPRDAMLGERCGAYPARSTPVARARRAAPVAPEGVAASEFMPCPIRAGRPGWTCRSLTGWGRHASAAQDLGPSRPRAAAQSLGDEKARRRVFPTLA